MKSVNLLSQNVDFERRRFRVDPKDLCESLVDVREDGSIQLVHSTAKSYLKKKYFEGTAMELEMATFCVDYLNLPVFTGPFSKLAVLDGSYGFVKYAVLNWARHLEAGLSDTSEPDDHVRGFLESFERLLESHWNSPALEIKIPKRTRDRLLVFHSSSKYHEITKAVASTQEQINRFGTMSDAECALDLGRMVAQIRIQIEAVVEDNDSKPPNLQEDFRDKYGSSLFRCSRFSCKYFTSGFASRAHRDGHEKRHERPFRCPDIHCTGFIGYAKEDQLARHLKDIHSDLAEQEHVFPTEAEVLESQREYEPEVNSEQENPATPLVVDPSLETVDVEAQSSSSVTAAEWQDSDRQLQASRPAKRAKTKTEFKCTQCEKTFTKRYNRDSHLKVHGIGPNFPCNICDTEFPRRSDLTRHMQTHAAVKAFKCGGVLQNGQYWGCGQSFVRQDILSSHHRSQKGKKCLAPLEEEEARAIAATHSMTDV
ncbi:hypothetical protein FKW77_007476 [Venturia effusa]|uniref:C2H2-type domain-containing protein n=1 Tax=Venturia effusa TaxID=50376 RepID=A0A517LCS1_9PEZI|nr:hypothetical protein FKW77_007476 [Venturia effusa]